MAPCLCAVAWLASIGPAAAVEVDAARHADPVIPTPPTITRFSSKLKPLWLEALAHPEADLRREAAQTIAIAHEQGMTGLDEAIDPLAEILDAADQHPAVMLACARTLIVLEARDKAPRLLKHALGGSLDMAQIVEPALARWGFRPARQAWLERLADSGTPRRRLVLAVRGLGELKDPKAAPALRAMVLAGDRAADVRLEAARALGAIQTEGLEPLARSLAADKSPRAIVDRLVAASLLSGHKDEPARAVLLDLAIDPEPSVAAIALGRLLEIDYQLLIPQVARTSIARDDANVRRLGARALVAWRTPEAVASLGPMLDDPHPEVRGYVRESLLEMTSDAGLRDRVLAQALAMLETEQWRGLEQASLILAAMDYKAAADRLVALLEFDRPEVLVTAAWALRRLAVPATLDAMFARATRQSDLMRTAIPATGVWEQMSQLFEAFGQMQYEPSAGLLRKYVPKNAPFPLENREAAVWALGHIYAGRPQADLVKSLSGRLADFDSMEPESPEIRRMSAVSLGRMKAEEALPVLRQFYEAEGVNSDVGYACAWAIQQITGEPIDQQEPQIHSPLNWFLVPID